MSLLAAPSDDGDGAALEMVRLRGHVGDIFGRVRRFGQAGWRLRAEAPVRKTEALAACLLRLIADGTIVPGARLPGERRLAAAAGISRVSVRSGLSILARCRLLEPGSGRVAPADDPAVLRLRTSYGETQRDATDMVRAVLPWLARQAAVRIDPQRAEPLTAAPTSAGPFCLALAAASGSPVAGRLVQALEVPLRSIAVTEEGASARDAVTAAVSAARPEAAALAARRYGAHLSLAEMAPPSSSDMAESVLAEMSGLRHAWLAERVETALRALISRSDLLPGSRLPGERRLADQLGTSRATVRLALEQLRDTGLIKVEPRKGAVIARAPGGAAETDRFLDMIELRALVEDWAVRRACTRASGDALGRLRRVTSQIIRPNRSERYRSEDEMAFHYAVSLASGSALHRFTLEMMQDLLLDYFDQAQLLIRAGRPRDTEVADQHAGIARAIERGEADLATAAMAEHSHAFEVAFLAERPPACLTAR